MNTKKGKGKNRPNKPPNPNPPQKVEVAKSPEKVDDPVIENVESEFKVEERVPEIVSEVVTPAEIEVKSVEEPKKPKRNRGKKKKQDKDELEESGNEKPKENIGKAETTDPTTGEESKVEVIEDKPVEKLIDFPNVAPNARKKKNKNKNANVEQEKKELENIPKIEETKDITTDISDPNLDIKRDLSPKPAEEMKPAKKKNKKKKRHDSEKSDKGEEISCTTDFLQLLGVEDIKKETKELVVDIKTDTIPESKTEVISVTKIEVVPETKTKNTPEAKTEVVSKPTATLEEVITDENVFKGNKNKKKGKKDKNNVSKTEIKEEEQQSTESAGVTLSEIKSNISPDIKENQDNVKETLKESKTETEKAPEELKSVIEEENKSKPTIAKPVDKKRKEKSNQALRECESEKIKISESPKSEEITPAVGILELKESVQVQEQIKPEGTASLEMSMPPEEATPTSLPELISLPQSPMGKKRKKSPKPPPKQQELKMRSEELHVEQIKDKEDKVISDKKLMEMTTSETVKEETFEETLKDKILETPKVVTTEPEFVKESASELIMETMPVESTSNINLEAKSGKKRKKSPKPVSKLELKKENEPASKETESMITPELPVESKGKAPVSVEPMKLMESKEDKSNVSHAEPSIEDIEISSVKGGESEGCISDIMPDVQYPRSSSQQRVDDNNNTIIREVVSPSDVKLGIPAFVPDTPFIKGDVTSTSPEFVASGIKVVDVESNVVKPNEEKTDIKSKMMEVNQDMEELRLSIERSLAELTSMEKPENVRVEKQYEDQYRSKADEIKYEPSSIPPVQMESTKAIGEESQTTESEILKIEKKPMDAIMPAPIPPLKSHKKEKSPQTEEKTKPSLPAIPLPPPLPKEVHPKPISEETKPIETVISDDVPPVCPARKDNKGKGKSKKKGKQETGQAATAIECSPISTSAEAQTVKEPTQQDTKKEEKKEERPDKSQDTAKKQSDTYDDSNKDDKCKAEDEASSQSLTDFEPIESFEDAMTSSVDDVNKTFEMIASEASGSHVNPEINIIAPTEDLKADPKDEKQKLVTPPKNLLGHPVIPVRSNKMDYKKEKNKTPNTIIAKVKIKDSIEIESKKQSKESQTENIKKLMQKKSVDESISTLNENEEFVYKYSFRKVFLPSVCHVCKKELKPMRVSCNYCHLLFYCSQKHKDEDYAQHQAFCFAVSTIVHLKDQKHIYEDAAAITGHNYRLLRMQMIVSCEKILKRKLVPWEQEALLYPRVCGDAQCREWRVSKLADCDGCGQIAYCSSNPDHLPKSHQRWCKSYSLYQKMVCYQQTRGRLEPKLPSRVMSLPYQMPDKINEVLAAMYEEKIDMNDVEYAALTQLATAPLTAVYSFQVYTNKMNSIYANGTYKKTSFTVHVVGAELQFEADALCKWELFFLHLRPDILQLRVVLIAPDLNPSNLPLELLGKVKLCEQCRQDKRRLLFSFQDKKTYSEYYRSDDFTTPDMVCAFNPGIQRSSVYQVRDPWPDAAHCILKQRVPFTLTSYTLEELRRDLARMKECADFNTISGPQYNAFASVRPDRNFISDDEIPLLFKNYSFAVVSGVF